MKTIKQGNNITANDFSIVQQLWNSVQMDAGKDLLTEILGKIKRNKSFKTDDEVYTYMFKEIIYPLVQNITLDFNRAGGATLFMSMSQDLPNGLTANTLQTTNERKAVNDIISKLLLELNKFSTIDDAYLLNLLKDTKAEVTKLLKQQLSTKTYYEQNITSYIDAIIKEVNAIFFDDAIKEIEQAIKENREAQPNLMPLYQTPGNGINELLFGYAIPMVASEVLKSSSLINDQAKRIEQEYEKLENARILAQSEEHWFEELQILIDEISILIEKQGDKQLFYVANARLLELSRVFDMTDEAFIERFKENYMCFSNQQILKQI